MTPAVMSKLLNCEVRKFHKGKRELGLQRNRDIRLMNSRATSDSAFAPAPHPHFLFIGDTREKFEETLGSVERFRVHHHNNRTQQFKRSPSSPATTCQKPCPQPIEEFDSADPTSPATSSTLAPRSLPNPNFGFWWCIFIDVHDLKT